MPLPTPPPKARRRRSNVAAAERRVYASKFAPPGYHTGSPAPSGTLPKSQVPATAPPRVIKQERQPTTSPQPSNVLGGRAGRGEVYLPEQQVNRGFPEAAVTGGSDRVGKKFTVGFDRAGNIIHLYGSDVPAAERRQVIKRRP